MMSPALAPVTSLTPVMDSMVPWMVAAKVAVGTFDHCSKAAAVSSFPRSSVTKGVTSSKSKLKAPPPSA